MNNNKTEDLRKKYLNVVKSLASPEYRHSDAQGIEETILGMTDLVYIRELVASVPEEHERLIIVMAILYWLEEYHPEEYAILKGEK